MSNARIKTEFVGNGAVVDGPFGTIRFEIDDPDLEVRRHDAAMWAALPWAMGRGGRLVIDGPVDPQARVNAEAFARLWQLWDPKRWHLLEIEAPVSEAPVSEAPVSEAPAPVPEDRIAFLSGGVDSAYALFRHGRDLDVRRCLTVMGFDYRLSDEASFQSLADANRRIAEYCGVPLSVARTNAFHVGGYWPHTHMATFMAIASLYSGQRTGVLMGSDALEAQDPIAFPWGSNRMSNRLLAGRDFAVEIRDYETHRGQKLAAMREHPGILENLRFCPRGFEVGGNCGRCGKCLRTKLHALLAWNTARPLFQDDAVDPGVLARVDAGERATQPDLRVIYQTALRQGDERIAGLVQPLILANDRMRPEPFTRPWYRINFNLRKRLGLRRR